MRLIIGISGSTGAIYGVRLLEVLHQLPGMEIHLVMSEGAKTTISYETEYRLEEVMEWAHTVHDPRNVGASIASGTFLTSGMIVAPCSMRSLAAIAHGQGDNLIHRAADVVLKERRKLVLMVRETPLNDIHLENMLKLSRMGVVILPPLPAFYNHPQNLDDMINHVTMRILDQFDIHLDVMNRWDGTMLSSTKSIE